MRRNWFLKFVNNFHFIYEVDHFICKTRQSSKWVRGRVRFNLFERDFNDLRKCLGFTIKNLWIKCKFFEVIIKILQKINQLRVTKGIKNHYVYYISTFKLISKWLEINYWRIIFESEYYFADSTWQSSIDSFVFVIL